jgi:hypothetical protein
MNTEPNLKMPDGSINWFAVRSQVLRNQSGAWIADRLGLTDKELDSESVYRNGVAFKDYIRLVA